MSPDHKQDDNFREYNVFVPFSLWYEQRVKHSSRLQVNINILRF